MNESELTAKKFKNFLRRNKLESKPFQMECFNWCSEKEQPLIEVTTKPGGILALEMGLGKTIIMLGLVKCNIKPHTLIVLPRALLDQWEKSIMQFCVCKPLVYHGSRPKSMKMTLSQIKATSQIILTTYGQVSLPSIKQMQKGRRRSLLHSIEWNRVICDEAHHVSHKKTNEFKGVQALKTEICWLVTGTPLQNNEKELYNLYSLFGLTDNKAYYNRADHYAETAKQIIFYGTKAGVGLELPALHEHIENVEWNNVAEAEFAWHIHSLLTFCNVPKKAFAEQIENESENVNALRMKYLARAQQVCVYPPMIQRVINVWAEHNTDPLEDEVVAPQGDGVVGAEPLAEPLWQSKINAVLKTLSDRKTNGCGKIVFCHYYTEIDVLAEQLLLADPTLRVGKFDGRVPNGQRAKILSTPVDILLAQIKMCREGLNLQDNYSEVYLISPHFNPATEQQAIARCWRMGQKKPVHVFRYIMGGNPPRPPVVRMVREGASGAGASGEQTPLPLGVQEGPSLPLGVQGGHPLTIDMFSALLHIKKQEFVARMASAASSNK